MDGISVIVPVYNEIKSVEETLLSLSEIMAGSGLSHEIMVVDDGSTDGTSDLLKKAARKGNVRLLRHPRNRGYGAALKTGIKESKYGHVFIVDCDDTYPLERIPEMARQLLPNECDMVVGARRGRDVHIPLVRRPAKWFIQLLANYLTGQKIPDLNSGFRGMKKDVIQKFFSVLPDGFSFTTTITIAMLTNDYRVKYVDISYRRRKGRSKIRPVKDTIGFIQLVIRTVLYFDPLKVFLPVSGVLFALGMGIFIYTYFFTEQVLDDTTVIILMAAFQILAIGLIADLIDKRMK